MSEKITDQITSTFINKDANCKIHEEEQDFKETIFANEQWNIRLLYEYGLKEYGRCVDKVYVDGNDGQPIHVGYIFQKRVKYEDSDETYLQEVWFTRERYKETITLKRLMFI